MVERRARPDNGRSGPARFGAPSGPSRHVVRANPKATDGFPTESRVLFTEHIPKGEAFPARLDSERTPEDTTRCETK
jgi:hypothetical protein